MAKNFRGKNIKKKRGTCPSCNRTGVKLLHEVKKDDKTIMVCKVCKKVDPAKLEV